MSFIIYLSDSDSVINHWHCNYPGDIYLHATVSEKNTHAWMSLSQLILLDRCHGCIFSILTDLVYEQ